MRQGPFVCVFALFPDLTQLDFTGAWEVLTRIPGAEAIVASVGGGPVRAQNGLVFGETRRLADVERCDLVCAPGGPGMAAAMLDEGFIAELRRLAEGADYVTSVCTGSLLLGAAGLLQGKRAACHWASRQFLEAFGAIATDERVTRDGRVITGGGVTAGIDFGLAVAAEVAGEEAAQYIQLAIEYAPAPPFNAGDPQTAPAHLLKRYLETTRSWTLERAETVARAAAALRDRAGR